MLELELSSDALQGFKAEAANTINWAIKNVYLHGCIYSVDSSITNSIVEHVASGASLPYALTSMFATRHYISGPSWTLSLNRAASRLKQVYVVINKANTAIDAFFSPLGNNASHIDDDTLEYQLVIGARKWPENFVDSKAETFMRLREASGQFYGSDSLSAGMTANDFTNGKAIYAIDLEKTGAQALMTGESTKGGATVSIEFRNAGTTVGDYVTVYQICDIVCELRAGSVSVLD